MRILTLAALALMPQDDVTRGWKHPWSGAKAGDRLKWRITSEMFGRKTAVERTEAVSKVEKDFVWIRWQEGGKKEHERQIFVELGSELTGKWSRTGEEELKVGTRSFRCAVYELKKESGNVVQTTRVWQCADAPYWAVKQSWTQDMKGKEPVGWVEELIGLDEVVKVGDKELKCAVVRKTTDSLGVKRVETIWWNDEVPGRAAKKTDESEMRGKKQASAVHELVEFEKK